MKTISTGAISSLKPKAKAKRKKRKGPDRTKRMLDSLFWGRDDADLFPKDRHGHEPDFDLDMDCTEFSNQEAEGVWLEMTMKMDEMVSDLERAFIEKAVELGIDKKRAAAFIDDVTRGSGCPF